MEHQDWKTVSWDKRYERPNGMSKKTYINEQAKKGNVTQIVKPVSANQNKDLAPVNSKKLDNEELPVPKKVGSEMGKRITKERCEKKMTQKELANALSLPLKTIQECENGKGIYNANIINKIDGYFSKRIR